jgi:hypothetical protein
MKSIIDFGFNGADALLEVIQSSTYRTIEQAFASLTLFTHPETVRALGHEGLFKIRRRKEFEKRGVVIDGVMTDDNYAPHAIFRVCNGIKKEALKELQLNHVYSKSYDPKHFSSIANICYSPAFISKLADHNKSVVGLLQYRVYDLYGYCPEQSPPTKPYFYDSLKFPDFLPAIQNPSEKLAKAFVGKKNRISKCIALLKSL